MIWRGGRGLLPVLVRSHHPNGSLLTISSPLLPKCPKRKALQKLLFSTTSAMSCWQLLTHNYVLQDGKNNTQALFFLANSYFSRTDFIRAEDRFLQGQHRFLSSGSHYDKWTNLSYDDLDALIQCGDIQLFDVREPKEILETGKIPCAVNIPLGKIKEALAMEDEKFVELYQVNKPQKQDTNIVFVGLSHIKSSTALELAHRAGFKKARHYYGGYEEWLKKQQPLPPE